MVKKPLANAGDVRDTGSIPGLGRSSGEGHGNPLQYSCLENPMDRRAWWATVCRVAKSQTQLNQHACILVYWYQFGSVTQSCLTLCDPMHCSLPGNSVHWILQARILEWVAMPFSRGSSQPRDRTHVSSSPCMAGGFFTFEPPGKPTNI